MPCRTEEPSPSELRHMYEKEFTHDSKLAEIFCSTMLQLEQIEKDSGVTILYMLPTRAQNWWTDHKERDRKRVNDERMELERVQKVATALAKLTPEKRNLLNIRKGPRC